MKFIKTPHYEALETNYPMVPLAFWLRQFWGQMVPLAFWLRQFWGQMVPLAFWLRQFWGQMFHFWNFFSKYPQSLTLLLLDGQYRLRKKFNISLDGRPTVCETSFLDRSQRPLIIICGTIAVFPGTRRSLVLNACRFYIPVVVGQILHLNLGARLAGYSRNRGQWHIIVCTWCIHGSQV
jgi:hypothetical protein